MKDIIEFYFLFQGHVCKVGGLCCNSCFAWGTLCKTTAKINIVFGSFEALPQLKKYQNAIDLEKKKKGVEDLENHKLW
jgi:hypothetical protein